MSNGISFSTTGDGNVRVNNYTWYVLFTTQRVHNRAKTQEMHAYRYPSKAKDADTRFKFRLLATLTPTLGTLSVCSQLHQRPATHADWVASAKPKKTTTCCFGSSHLPGNCTRLATATITHRLATVAVTQNFTATSALATHGQRGWNYSRSQT